VLPSGLELTASGAATPLTGLRTRSSRRCKMPAKDTPGVLVNNSDLQRYKRLLRERLDDLSARPAVAFSPAPGAGGPQGDLVDQANADSEAGLHIRLHQHDAHLSRAIEAALARIAQDRFGVCEKCGSPISKARLEAVPWTRLCRDCKESEPPDA